jgi:hypothetical protein
MKLRQNGIVSFLIRLASFQARGGARMKLYGMTIDEWWMSLRSAFFKDKIERIPYSMLDVQCSMFDVHQFLFRFDRPVFWPAAGLNL